MNNLFHWLMPAAVLCAPVFALAQSTPPDPTDAKTSVPPLRYQSAFADYKPWQDAKPGDWRALNDGLQGTGAGGGHAGHGMSGMSAPAMPMAASAPAGKASAPAHGSHHKQGGKQ